MKLYFEIQHTTENPFYSIDVYKRQLYQRYFPNGASAIFTIEVKGGQEEAHRFIDSLEIFSLLANVADE